MSQVLRNLIFKVQSTLDEYGERLFYDPGMKRKSWVKSCASFYIFLGWRIFHHGWKSYIIGTHVWQNITKIFSLSIWSLVKLFYTNPIVTSEGANIQFNIKTPTKKHVIDFPVVQLQVNHTITFYEQDEPSLQKIEVVDRTGKIFLVLIIITRYWFLFDIFHVQSECCCGSVHGWLCCVEFVYTSGKWESGSIHTKQFGRQKQYQ